MILWKDIKKRRRIGWTGHLQSWRYKMFVMSDIATKAELSLRIL